MFKPKVLFAVLCVFATLRENLSRIILFPSNLTTKGPEIR
jgi:hypothetical protein